VAELELAFRRGLSGRSVAVRLIGIVLVLIGGLALGYQGFALKLGQPVQATATQPWWHLSPVLGGIALVSGLLLLASSGRREET
jgi:hypothetical protein